jgi:hypothetical protein
MALHCSAALVFTRDPHELIMGVLSVGKYYMVTTQDRRNQYRRYKGAREQGGGGER